MFWQLSGQAAESHKRYRALFELSPLANFVIQGERIQLVNPAAERMLGYTAAEMIRQEGRELFLHPDFRATQPERRKRYIEGNRAEPFHVRYIRKDGEVIDVSVIGQSITWDGMDAQLLISRDITDRVKAEELLAKQADVLSESEQRYRALFEISPLANFIVQDGRIRLVNPAAERILGYSAAELIGQIGSEMFLHPDCIPGQDERRRRYAEGNRAEPIRVQYIRKDREVIDVEVVG